MACLLRGAATGDRGRVERRSLAVCSRAAAVSEHGSRRALWISVYLLITRLAQEADGRRKATSVP